MAAARRFSSRILKAPFTSARPAARASSGRLPPSFVTQGGEGIDARGAAGGKVAGHQRNQGQKRRGPQQNHGIRGAEPEQHGSQHAAEKEEAGGEADGDSDQRQ